MLSLIPPTVYLMPDAVQERLSSWFLKARTAVTEVVGPMINQGPGLTNGIQTEHENAGLDDIMITIPEMTVNRRTRNGVLSLEAVISIEQFSR